MKKLHKIRKVELPFGPFDNFFRVCNLQGTKKPNNRRKPRSLPASNASQCRNGQQLHKERLPVRDQTLRCLCRSNHRGSSIPYETSTLASLCSISESIQKNQRSQNFIISSVVIFIVNVVVVVSFLFKSWFCGIVFEQARISPT